jgi:hypothetical protein
MQSKALLAVRIGKMENNSILVCWFSMIQPKTFHGDKFVAAQIPAEVYKWDNTFKTLANFSGPLFAIVNVLIPYMSLSCNSLPLYAINVTFCFNRFFFQNGQNALVFNLPLLSLSLSLSLSRHAVHHRPRVGCP